MGILTALAGLFSSSKVTDVAVDGLRKLGGLDDMTQQEKADYLLKFIAATKHQSPVRRLIALSLTGIYTLVCLIWLIAAISGYGFGVVEAATLAVNLKVFFVEVVLQPFNLILSFYFVIHIAQKVGK